MSVYIIINPTVDNNFMSSGAEV